MGAAYDAIVVGSGFGGGIAACRLAEARRRVCVLERGARFTPDQFIERPNQAAHLFWHDRLNPYGMFDVRLMRDLTVITAAGVGGGSLWYANVQLPAPSDLFDQGWPSAITRTALDPWYALTEEALQPVDTPGTPQLDKVRAFGAAARLAGRTHAPLPVAVYFDADGAGRDHPFSGVHQEPCTNLGRCNLGCPQNARNTVDITYLARAEQHGAEVRCKHLVHRLTAPVRPGGMWQVAFRGLDGEPAGVVEAPLLVLSAGTMGTVRLLLANRRRIPGLSPALGSHFSGNGDALGMALDPHAPGVQGAHNDVGPTMTSWIDYVADRRLMLADGGLPPHFEGLIEAARGVKAIRGHRRARLWLHSLLTHIGLTDHRSRPGP
jgi:cholesterol oxidase